MSTSVARQSTRAVGRPLKILVPMIQGELQQGDSAGREHYRRAGEMLIEAKDQVAYGAWGRWLKKNFDMTQWTAGRYMRWARTHDHFGAGGTKAPYSSLRELSGHTERDREERRSPQQKKLRDVLRDVARDEFVQERQTRDDEVTLHRELAIELIEIGYRALATRLHPDRGGSKDAMSRLNRVRDELKSISQNRRFL
jgi:hypothetical protein